MKQFIGNRFGRLKITGEISAGESPTKRRKLIALCDCGTEKVINPSSLHSVKSCGCWQRERMGKITAMRRSRGDDLGINRSHGMSKSSEYRAWRSMRDRCHRPSAVGYHNYGGRGIQVCDRWQASFENFIADMGMKPLSSERLTLERLNVDGDYCPENCCWATYKQQRNNTRFNHYITINGITKTLTQWCEETGVPRKTAGMRIHDLGWAEADAVTKPVSQR